MKHIKSFKQLNEEVSGDGSPINCNSGACSLHLNFNINRITNLEKDRNYFIYPGVQYTTSTESKNLLEEFAKAIQSYDLDEIGAFFNGKQAYFGEDMVVSCGSNNFNMREIPEDSWNTSRFKYDGDYNYLNERQLKRWPKIDHLEEGKIYVAFEFQDMKNLNNIQYYTGLIDVTEPVKKFIEKSKQLNQPIQVR